MRVLAISPSHDSSVCVYNNGRIEFFAKEERFTEFKRDEFPFIVLEKVYELFKQTIDYATYTWSRFDCEKFDTFSAYVYKKFKLPLSFVNKDLPHHRNHAALAFYNSNFTDALVVVVDRNGSIRLDNTREAESVYECHYPYTFIPTYKNYWSSTTFSIVKVYEAATTLIGQNALENGKVMGLAAYGDIFKIHEKLFRDLGPFHEKFEHITFAPNKKLPTSIFKGLKNKITSTITPQNYQFYADKCRQVQLETQEAVLTLIKRCSASTGIKNICITGGYGLNVVANSFYVKSLPKFNFYFEPLSDDSGTSIGAAMLLYRHLTKDSKKYSVPNNFYHFYENCYNRYGTRQDVSKLCELLMKQKIVGLFEGAPEAGPRALGHRSVLFDPRNPNGKDIINTLKEREWYRPFAGVILEEKFKDYFETMGLTKSRDMTINFDCKPGVAAKFPAIVHVDHTCRVQTVASGFLYDLLKLFYKKTGCPFLLNTSLNVAGAPLIQTKTDAVKFFHDSQNKHWGGIYFVDDTRLYDG